MVPEKFGQYISIDKDCCGLQSRQYLNTCSALDKNIQEPDGGQTSESSDCKAQSNSWSAHCDLRLDHKTHKQNVQLIGTVPIGHMCKTYCSLYMDLVSQLDLQLALQIQVYIKKKKKPGPVCQNLVPTKNCQKLSNKYRVHLRVLWKYTQMNTLNMDH